jgi:hypothetical protein
MGIIWNLPPQEQLRLSEAAENLTSLQILHSILTIFLSLHKVYKWPGISLREERDTKISLGSILSPGASPKSPKSFLSLFLKVNFKELIKLIKKRHIRLS